MLQGIVRRCVAQQDDDLIPRHFCRHRMRRSPSLPSLHEKSINPCSLLISSHLVLCTFEHSAGKRKREWTEEQRGESSCRTSAVRTDARVTPPLLLLLFMLSLLPAAASKRLDACNFVPVSLPSANASAVQNFHFVPSKCSHTRECETAAILSSLTAHANHTHTHTSTAYPSQHQRQPQR